MIYYIERNFLNELPEISLIDWMKPYKEMGRVEDALLDYAFTRENQFEDSTTSDSKESYRKSKVFYITYEDQLFEWWKSLIVPHCERKFFNNIQDLNYSDIEIQLTHHGESNYYKAHRDSEEVYEGTKNRVITFVYYFYIEPKRFDGGNLKLYDDDNNNHVLIEPISDTLITFLSKTLHEVTNVNYKDMESEKNDFKSGRFTINGWISYT